MSCQFELLHLGLNSETPQGAEELSTLLGHMFNLPTRTGNKSAFAGDIFECMRLPWFGTHGHIALGTSDVEAAVRELEAKGCRFRQDTASYKEGVLQNIYLEDTFGGFAVHILRTE